MSIEWISDKKKLVNVDILGALKGELTKCPGLTEFQHVHISVGDSALIAHVSCEVLNDSYAFTDFANKCSKFLKAGICIRRLTKDAHEYLVYDGHPCSRCRNTEKGFVKWVEYEFSFRSTLNNVTERKRSS